MSPRKKAGETGKAQASAHVKCQAPGSKSREAVGPKSSGGSSSQKVNGQTGSGTKLKIFWAVFNDSFEPVALFAYADHAKAVRKAEQLTASLRIPHFVQKIKRVVSE
ncbi:MAG: hypothetical protein NZ899_07740 [Thermoguttaceae bacterium]|nr:hypothetical protein [Thermoguttaceae bacterium]MDW8079033.1 hypothetical protein [Thermoguttaceae bacterium]